MQPHRPASHGAAPGSNGRRLAVALRGGALVVVGLALVPLPGPGWPVVGLGVHVLGAEFRWARRLSGVVGDRVAPAVRWTRGAAWPVRGAVGVALVAAAVAPLLPLAR